MQPNDALAVLKWYRDAGVDEAIAEEAVPMTRPRHERPARRAPVATAPFAASPAAEATAPAPAQTRAMPRLAGSEEATSDARRIAASCASLAELEDALRAFDGCALKLTATQLVFADGHPDADVMIVGEAPGADEDRLGKPFVGQSGQLLDRMLAAIGLSRASPEPGRSVYITNIVVWRPPGNRQPNPGEIGVCLPFLERHIALKRPKVLIAAGGTAAAGLLGTKEGITRIHGRWFERSVPGLDAPLPTTAIYHPAFLMRSPSQKREAWRDLLAIQRKLRELGG